MTKISAEIIRSLERAINSKSTPENCANYKQFVKERLENPIGLRAPVLTAISTDCFKTIKHLPMP